MTLRDTSDFIRTFSGFPFALQRFLAHPLTLDDARRIVADRLAHREDNFLRIAERAVYGNPRSPYLALLRLAGCELGDLRRLVSTEGLDAALQTIRKAGVYVTFEEFKGRSAIVRGSTTIAVAPRDFDNPGARRDVSFTTGGSTGLATDVHHDLDYIAATAPLYMLMFEAWGVLDAPALHWVDILPGAGLRFMLQRACFSRKAEPWYSRNGWFDSRSWIKYDLAMLYNLFWMRAFGLRVPVPKIARIDQAEVVARHVREVLDEYGQCLVYANVSAGLRIAVAAEAAGLDLTGTTLRLGGEPITAAKVGPMRRVGARVLPIYGAIETGAIGVACARPAEVDHVHLASDATALITYPVVVDATGESVDAFNLTSLVDASSKVMINYQIDDYGVVEQRDCGCPLHAAGYTTSLHTIRSYSKVLSEGVTLIGADIQHILHEILPSRFGGSPLDYQLLEDEDAQGLTRLYLVISPRIEIADEGVVLQTLLQALRASNPRSDAAGAIWQNSGTVQVKRQEPAVTARGKLVLLDRPKRAGTLLILLLACQCLFSCSDRSATTPGTNPADAAARRAANTLRFVDLINLDVRDIPLLMAFDELETHGYVIEKTYLGSGALITDVIVRGDADVAMINNQTAWTAITKGADIRTISQFTSAATLLAGNAAIKSCGDLAGRRVGVPSISGLSPLLFRLYLTRHCPGTTPQLLVLPESAGRAAALMSGAIDAAMMPGEELIKIQRQSSVPFHIVMSNAGEFPEIQIDGLHIRREWAAQHREMVLDLLRAQLRAHRLINESPQVLYEQAVKRLSLDPDTAKAIADTHLQTGIWDLNAGLTPETVQETINLLITERAVPPGTTAAQVADLSYLDTVLQEIGRRKPQR